MKKVLFVFVAIISLAVTASPLLAEEVVKTATPVTNESTMTKEPATVKESAAVAKLINVNMATASELEKLPGVGKKSAAAIVTYRTEKGKFKTPKDLLKVNGVGKKTLEKIQPLIRFE